MKKKMISIICLILALMLMLGACGQGNTAETNAEVTKRVEASNETTLNGNYSEKEITYEGDSVALCASEFLVVYSSSVYDDAKKNTVGKLLSLIQENTGKTLESVTDSGNVVGDFELIVGSTSRPENIDTADITYYDFGWKLIENKIVIYGGSTEALENAVTRFVEKYYSAADNDIIIPCGVVFEATYSSYDFSSISILGVDIAEYKIATPKNYYSQAESIYRNLGRLIGYKLDIVSVSDKDELEAGKYIRIGLDISDDRWCSGYKISDDGSLIFFINGRSEYVNNPQESVDAFFNDELSVKKYSPGRDLDTQCKASFEPVIERSTEVVENINKVYASKKYLSGTTDKDSVSYLVNEKMIFRINLMADNKVVGCDQFKWTLTADDGTSETGIEDGKTGELIVLASISKPGFVRLRVEACDKYGIAISGVDTYEGGACANFAEIDKIKDEPEDFDEFWSQQLSLLDGVEPEIISCTQRSDNNTEFDTYNVKIKSYDGTHGDFVSGILAVPKNAKKGSLKLLVYFQGAGTAGPSGPITRSGYATLYVCAHSMEIGSSYSDATYYRNSEYNSDKNTVYFKEMILRDIQAARFMMKYFSSSGTDSRFAGLWNGKDMISEGGSQGGFQAIAVAALEKRITYVNVNFPWLCDIGGYGVEGRQNSTYMPPYTEALEYYDTINFGKRLTVDITISPVGLGDYVANPTGITALYNNIPDTVNKKIVYQQNRTHGRAPQDNYSYIVEN